MYNRYLPQEKNWVPVGNQYSEAVGKNQSPSIQKLFGSGGISNILEKFKGKGLAGRLRLENMDVGDILLLLIVLYLLAEGDDLDLVIALGAVLLLGLADL